MLNDWRDDRDDLNGDLADNRIAGLSTVHQQNSSYKAKRIISNRVHTLLPIANIYGYILHPCNLPMCSSCSS